VPPHGWRHPDAYAAGQLDIGFHQEWFTGRAADGFNVVFPYLPGALDDFAALVIPELQRRGLFRTSYASRTLRGNLGLPRPASRYAGS
jgi:hypothetical protein